jgi:hypothetical protein
MNPNKEVAKSVKRSIDIIRHTIFGENHKLLSDLNANFDFGNVEANKKFLEYLGIGPETIKKIAGNKDTMRNLIEYFHMQKTGLFRGTKNISESGTVGKIGFVNYAPANGNYAGGGGNNVTIVGNSGYGPYEWYKQLPLTYHYDKKIKNAEDLLNRVLELDRGLNTKKYAGRTLQDWDRFLANLNDPVLNARVAREFDLPILFGGKYGTSKYVGQYSPEEDVISYGLSLAGRKGDNPFNEAGRPLEIYKEKLTTPHTEVEYSNDLGNEFNRFSETLRRSMLQVSYRDAPLKTGMQDVAGNTNNVFLKTLLESKEPMVRTVAKKLQNRQQVLRGYKEGEEGKKALESAKKEAQDARTAYDNHLHRVERPGSKKAAYYYTKDILTLGTGAATAGYGTYKGAKGIARVTENNEVMDAYRDISRRENGYYIPWDRLSNKEKVQFLADHMEEISEYVGKNYSNSFELPLGNKKISVLNLK